MPDGGSSRNVGRVVGVTRPRVIGRMTSRASTDLRDFLCRNGVPYIWLDLDHDPLLRLLGVENIAHMELPVCVLPEGEVLEAPSTLEVARRVGLATLPEQEVYDLAVLGGGPAGLTAAVYGASEGLRTILIERYAPGGQAGTSSQIENYLGFPDGLSGAELTERALEQARRFGAEVIVANWVEAADTTVPRPVPLTLSDGTLMRTYTVIMATGVSYRMLDAAGAKELVGLGVYYGAAPGEERFYDGGNVCVVGGANSAGQAALNVAKVAASTTMVVRADSLEKGMSAYLVERIESTPSIDVRLGAEVVRAAGEEKLEQVVVRKADGSEETLPMDALFVLIGGEPQGYYTSDLQRDQRGFVLTGPDVMADPPDGKRKWPLERDPYFLETSRPGVFAAGDIRSGSVKRVASAVGEGAMAVQLVHRVLAEMKKT